MDLTGLDADQVLEQFEDLLNKPVKDLGLSKTETLFTTGVFDEMFGDYVRDQIAEEADDDRRRAEAGEKRRLTSVIQSFLDGLRDAFTDSDDSSEEEQDREMVERSREMAKAFTEGFLDGMLGDFFRTKQEQRRLSS